MNHLHWFWSISDEQRQLQVLAAFRDLQGTVKTAPGLAVPKRLYLYFELSFPGWSFPGVLLVDAAHMECMPALCSLQVCVVWGCVEAGIALWVGESCTSGASNAVRESGPQT